jgi:hypothetical protein
MALFGFFAQESEAGSLESEAKFSSQRTDEFVSCVNVPKFFTFLHRKILFS